MVQHAKSLVSLGFLSLALSVASPAAAAEQQVVNYGVQPSTMPIYIARATGLLDEVEKKHNIEIKFHSFSYGAPENMALAAGEIDIAQAGMGPAIVASARLPAKLIAVSMLEMTAMIVPTDSPIQSVADLKGKTVAFPGRGSQQYPLTLKALDDVGLAEGDITLFKTKGSDVPTLIMNGDVDAGVTWEPHSSIAIASGKARVLKRAKEIMPLKNGFYLGGGVYAREEFIDAHPEIVQDIVTAEVKAIDFILKNPDEAANLWHEQIKTPVDVIRTSLREGLSAYSLDAVPEEATLRKFTDWLKDADILKPTDNVKIDSSFATNALKEVTN